MTDTLPFAESDDLPNDIPSLCNPIPYTLVNSRPLTDTPFVAPYVPLNPSITATALALAGVDSSDTLVDLGCGDGRILVAALQDPSEQSLLTTNTTTPNTITTTTITTTTMIQPCAPSRCIGVELDPYLAAYIRNTQSSLISTGRLVILEQDMFTVDLESIDATVIIMYLLPSGLNQLKPQLAKWLLVGTAPGALSVRRIVTITYSIPDWNPVQEQWACLSSNSFMGGSSATPHCLFRYEAKSICY
ncbi:hypothetical protein BASA50_000566 [Batrachochytrium salamandrivorans]|uniref:Methyltransferase domain-containing protein n=1 Tax=Batrachochytrium salamandrivorans TaxID=1357716 RepID=A0ABQ8EWN3_9FUNG|nr:hypothetical protein BASA62_009894 [Batrachochytrium salamandrivorans]KAH6572479.1 hypothetical protein BASA60_006606 [Batrachochytrium salamandrivorans]KAH6586393.1 hypothetical protein BASA50_000566 [Batrachochytrium salamandrivorans]KAH6602028.1 hypothetical protein BASA61_001531 [Batrachochytrium salamandrivorans]KAH9268069.1 hypothetical protein BASA83_009575 [Batrachochytrium salamandrivorans]